MSSQINSNNRLKVKSKIKFKNNLKLSDLIKIDVKVKNINNTYTLSTSDNRQTTPDSTVNSVPIKGVNDVDTSDNDIITNLKGGYYYAVVDEVSYNDDTGKYNILDKQFEINNEYSLYYVYVMFSLSNLNLENANYYIQKIKSAQENAFSGSADATEFVRIVSNKTSYDDLVNILDEMYETAKWLKDTQFERIRNDTLSKDELVVFMFLLALFLSIIGLLTLDEYSEFVGNQDFSVFYPEISEQIEHIQSVKEKINLKCKYISKLYESISMLVEDGELKSSEEISNIVEDCFNFFKKMDIIENIKKYNYSKIKFNKVRSYKNKKTTNNYNDLKKYNDGDWNRLKRS